MAGDDGEAPDETEVVRLRSCSEEAGAFLRAIPYNPHFSLRFNGGGAPPRWRRRQYPCSDA